MSPWGPGTNLLVSWASILELFAACVGIFWQRKSTFNQKTAPERQKRKRTTKFDQVGSKPVWELQHRESYKAGKFTLVPQLSVLINQGGLVLPFGVR